VLAPPVQSSAEIAAQNLTFTAALWIVVAVILWLRRGRLEVRAA
jgi:hypothetical protein